MIDMASVNPFVIPMTTPNMTVEYNDAGQWVLRSQAIDYTHGRFAKHQSLKAGKNQENGSLEEDAQTGYPQKAIAYRPS